MASDVTLITSSALPRANAEAMPAKAETYVLSRALGTATKCQPAAVFLGQTPGTIEPDRHTIDKAVAKWRKHIHSLRTSASGSASMATPASWSSGPSMLATRNCSVRYYWNRRWHWLAFSRNWMPARQEC